MEAARQLQHIYSTVLHAAHYTPSALSPSCSAVSASSCSGSVADSSAALLHNLQIDSSTSPPFYSDDLNDIAYHASRNVDDNREIIASHFINNVDNVNNFTYLNEHFKDSGRNTADSKTLTENKNMTCDIRKSEALSIPVDYRERPPSLCVPRLGAPVKQCLELVRELVTISDPNIIRNSISGYHQTSSNESDSLEAHPSGDEGNSPRYHGNGQGESTHTLTKENFSAAKRPVSDTVKIVSECHKDKMVMRPPLPFRQHEVRSGSRDVPEKSHTIISLPSSNSTAQFTSGGFNDQVIVVPDAAPNYVPDSVATSLRVQ